MRSAIRIKSKFTIIYFRIPHIYMVGVNAVKNEILKLLPPCIRYIINQIDIDYNSLIELRFRICEPLILVFTQGEYFVQNCGGLTLDRKKHIV